MQLILPFKIQPSTHKISYEDKILFIGSCFSEEIGNKLKTLKFNVLQNPNGILYDPISISNSLISYVENKKYEETDLFQLDEVWHSWQHHSVFSGMERDKVLSGINYSQHEAHKFLKNASWLIITPGTSYNYTLKESGDVVANCHKAVSNLFEKKLVPTAEIIFSLQNCITKLRSFNHNLKIIFTISPVRHTRDGIVENNRSKARLIEAIHSVKEKNNDIFYFPSYELVLDVLRDYRFFKTDFIHPDDTAIEFVFENFCNIFLDEAAGKLLDQIKEIIVAVSHKPFYSQSTAYKKFCNSQLSKIRLISQKYPSLDFSAEENFFQEK